MSTLAKFLIVVQALLVMGYLGVASTLFQHRRDWRDSYGKLRKRYNKMAKRSSKEVAAIRENLKAKKSYLDLKNNEINNLQDERDKAQKEYEGKSQDLASATKNFDSEEASKRSLETTYDTRNNEVNSLRSRINELKDSLDENRNRRKRAEVQIARLSSYKVNLEEDLKVLSDDFSKVQGNLRKKELLIAMATERGVDFRDILGGPPMKPIKGLIQAVKNDTGKAFIIASIGSSEGVKIGYHLSVYRGQQFVGKIIVERAEPTVSSCRVLFVVDGQQIQVGDNITTRLP